jgi:eukaryotic-like serine/threonine-protein kinase
MSHSAKEWSSPQNALGSLNVADKVKIDYPSDWLVSSNGLSSYTNIVGFYSPLSSVSDKFPEHLILSVVPHAKNITLDDYANLINNRANMIGMRLVTQYLTTMSGRPTQSSVYELHIGNSTIINHVFYTLNENKAYMISFFADRAEYTKYIPILERMISIFEITS